MKIDKIVIGEDEIKVRRGHREKEQHWYDRVEEPKTAYKRNKSNSKWWEDEMEEDNE